MRHHIRLHCCNHLRERVAIAEIDFVGNATFDEDQLLDEMSTGEEGFLWYQTGTYDPATVRQDLRQALPDFYGSWGFLDFAVTGDTLIVDPNSGKARLITARRLWVCDRSSATPCSGWQVA